MDPNAITDRTYDLTDVGNLPDMLFDWRPDETEFVIVTKCDLDRLIEQARANDNPDADNFDVLPLQIYTDPDPLH
jgi:hypothetical protein